MPLTFENYATMPAVLNEGMIQPVAPLSIRGFIWYQGEANAESQEPQFSWLTMPDTQRARLRTPRREPLRQAEHRFQARLHRAATEEI